MSQVRKQWFYSFCLYWGISFIFATSQLLSELGRISESDVKTVVLFSGVMSIVGVFIWAWISYHCAYKKRGTKWLMWTLIILPVMALFTFFQLFISNSPIKILLFHSGSGWIPGLFVLMWLSVIYYWINCLWFRKENLALKNASKPEPNAAS